MRKGLFLIVSRISNNYYQHSKELIQMLSDDFQEIEHCGGAFTIKCARMDGQLAYRVGIRHVGIGPASFFGVLSTFDGQVVDTVTLGGIGQQQSPELTSFPGTTLLIASDSEAYFGRQCPRCSGYWRSKSAPAQWATTCPYCALQAKAHCFLTKGQQAYITEALRMFSEVFEQEKEGEFSIDFDAIAEQVANGHPKPDFYHTEESQQNRYTCNACNSVEDILGKFGFCSCCGVRNDFQMLKQDIEKLRTLINSGDAYNNYVKEAVSHFDTFGRTFSRLLSQKIRMTPRRKDKLNGISAHNLETFHSVFLECLDIDAFKNLNDEEIHFTKLMFHRRHIYEHNGGEVDEKYLKDSGDTTVKLKQMIRETQSNAHRVCTTILKLAESIHQGVLSIFPPIYKPNRI